MDALDDKVSPTNFLFFRSPLTIILNFNLSRLPNKGEPVNPCMDVYKEKIQSGGSLDKLKLRIMVIGDLHNKELVEYTWSPTASMRTLKCLLADEAKHK